MPVWLARTRRVSEFAPTNPISLARYQWETRLGDLKNKSVVHVHMIDEQSLVYNASRGDASLLFLPKSSQYATPIFDSQPLGKDDREQSFSSLDIHRAWSWDPNVLIR